MPPRAAEVLVQLALAEGELVTREDLLESVWGDRKASNDALSHAVGEIRSALADHPDDPRYVQTVPRRGYRLLVRPEPLEPDPEVEDEGPVVMTLAGAPPFLQELMRRKVVQTAVAYLVFGWLLIQIADATFDHLPLPWWLAPFITYLVVIGFPIAIVLSWFMQFAEGRLRLDRRKYPGAGSRSGPVYLAVLGALVLSAGGLGLYRLMSGDDSIFGDPPPPTVAVSLSETLDIPVLPNSIAVLRFLNIGGDHRFSDGLSENLLHLLASFNELAVPSRTSTWELSGGGMPSTQIASRLNVRYVLEGSVQQVEDNIRVTAQLIDGQSGHHLWSENYDRRLNAKEFFAILDDISRRVVERLQLSLSLESSAVLVRMRTSNDQALDFYLQGREQLRLPKSEESLGLAELSFRNAIVEDPQFAEAHAGLCEAHLAWYVLARSPAEFEKAQVSCLQALALDDSIGEVYAAVGSLHRYAGRYDEARIELERARELLPHSAAVLEELGRVYRAQGELELAERTFHEAIVQEPSSWSAFKSLGNFLYRTGRYADALPFYQYVIELAPDHAPGHNNLGSAYYMLGRFEEANAAWEWILDRAPTRSALMNYANSLYYAGDFQASADSYGRALEFAADDYLVWENYSTSLRFAEGESERQIEAVRRATDLAAEALRINPDDTTALSRIAVMQARAGEGDEARATIRRLRDLGWDDPEVSLAIGKALLELKDLEGALLELERSVEMGFPIMFIAADPELQLLHESPRFAALVTPARGLADTDQGDGGE